MALEMSTSLLFIQSDCFEAISRVPRALKVLDRSCLAGGTSLWSDGPTDSGNLK